MMVLNVLIYKTVHNSLRDYDILRLNTMGLGVRWGRGGQSSIYMTGKFWGWKVAGCSRSSQILYPR